MNQETKSVTFGGDGHPDENELLLALERELPPDGIAQIDAHLGECWSCRARSEEMHRGILAFVEYRENLYLPSLEGPPTGFSSFPRQLQNVIAGIQPPSAGTRLRQALSKLLALPTSIRWASAVAVITSVLLFWTQVLFNPTVVSAQELLTRAMAAQNPSSSVGGGGRRNVVRQRVQIRSGMRTFVREFQWTAGKGAPETHWEIQRGIQEWNSPMTAEGFMEWRNSVAVKNDTVKRSGEILSLTTAAETGPVKRASIVVRALDFHPLEQHILFADNQALDFLELGFEVSDEVGSPVPQGPEDRSLTPAVGVTKGSPTNLDETELNVRYILFTHKLDLGEDLHISQVANQVSLSGTASSKERVEAIRAALVGVEDVRVQVTFPDAASVSPSMPRSAAEGVQVTSTPALGEELLMKAFPLPEDRTNFVDRCLIASDTALSHAWVLKRLADRYSAADQRRLRPESAEKLREMLRTHLEELGQANADVDPLLTFLPGSQDKSLPAPADLQSGIISLFNQVQEQDSLVAKIVAGTPPNGGDLPAAAEEFSLSHRAIKELADSLRGFLQTR
jgi:hypothetical protein